MNAYGRNRSASSGSRRALIRHLAAAALFAAIAPGAPTQEAVYDATQVKAAFLYHFGSYVEWPASAPPTEPITIAVLGEPAIAAQLADFLPGRRIQERAVEVVAITRIEDARGAEILFIGPQHNQRLGQLIAALERRPTLVVTDAANGLDNGAMLNFQLVDERVRFEISVPRAEEAGLVLSSRLLSAALRVETSWCCYGSVHRSLAVASATKPTRVSQPRDARQREQ